MEVIDKYKGAFTGEEIDEILSRIPLLQTGGGGGDKFYKYVQENAENEWEIVHNLGKFPSVTVIEYYSRKEAFGDVEYISNEKLIIRFSEKIKGQAYLN